MFFIIAALGIAADLYSKALVERTMALGEARTLIPVLLDLNHIRNYGAAWSILQHKVNFLLIFTGIMLAGLVFYYFRNAKKAAFAEKLGISMIFAGGCGNFFSRISVGYVTDFFDIHIIPVFNVADIFITCGCVLVLVYYFFFYKEENEEGASGNAIKNAGKVAKDPDQEGGQSADDGKQRL